LGWAQASSSWTAVLPHSAAVVVCGSKAAVVAVALLQALKELLKRWALVWKDERWPASPWRVVGHLWHWVIAQKSAGRLRCEIWRADRDGSWMRRRCRLGLGRGGDVH
jgi:hypothetical protein